MLVNPRPIKPLPLYLLVDLKPNQAVNIEMASDSVRQDDGRGKNIPVPKSEWVVVNRDDLRIIDQKVWDEIRARKSRRQPVNRPQNGKFTGYQGIRHRAKYMFSGLLKCGYCGSSMIVVSSGDYSVYLCNNHWSRGKTACTNGVRVNRRKIENILLESISERLLNPNTVTWLHQKTSQYIKTILKSWNGDLPRLKRQLQKERKELTNLIEFVKGGNTSSTVRDMIIDKEHIISTLEEKIRQTSCMAASIEESSLKRQIVEKISDLRGVFSRAKAPLPVVQAELRRLIDGKITLKPEDHGEYYDLKTTIRARLSSLVAPPLSVMGGSGTGNRTPV